MVQSVKYMEDKHVKHVDLSSIPRIHVKKKKTVKYGTMYLGSQSQGSKHRNSPGTHKPAIII